MRHGEVEEHEYIEGYARCLEIKKVELEDCINVQQMWEHVKLAIVDSAEVQ